ncbi:MAG: hypothetical protein SFZ24_08430 [Planctomycetota bacterium]|nr:hypothetical protein [Planctomycetota bacterium]
MDEQARTPFDGTHPFQSPRNPAGLIARFAALPHWARTALTAVLLLALLGVVGLLAISGLIVAAVIAAAATLTIALRAAAARFTALSRRQGTHALRRNVRVLPRNN